MARARCRRSDASPELPTAFLPSFLNLRKIITSRRCVAALLSAWVLVGCLLLVVLRKPWEGRVFEPGLSPRQVPLTDFATTGLWLGLVGSSLIAVLLLATLRWWGPGGEPAATFAERRLPVRAGSAKWFLPLLIFIVFVALWQRWPAMGHSFWGDESWAFCSYVHGVWRPVEKGGDPQGPIRFRAVDWEQAIFGDQEGNNHWLATLSQRLSLRAWQAMTGREIWAFDERIVRLVPLMAGLGSLVVLAWFLRDLGHSVEGLVAALFMEFHPWHIRFSTEARGYSLMLLFFIAALWLMFVVWRTGRLWHWVALGLVQFLVMYSWKGALYPLAFVNLVFGAALLRRWWGRRDILRVQGSRWLMANLVGAMLFLPLAASSQLQVSRSLDTVRQRARQMERVWAVNTASETLLGMPYYEQDPENPHEVSVERLSRQSPWPILFAVVIIGLMTVGLWRLWRRERLLASFCLAILLAGVVTALHFKFGLRIELLPWYLLYCLPAWSILVAAAVSPGLGQDEKAAGFTWRMAYSPRWCLAPLALGFFAFFETPMSRDLLAHPKEDFRGAWELSRGRHEAPGYAGPSTVHTVWLWRHGEAYDSRGDTHVRDLEALRRKIAAVEAFGGELYVIVGHIDLSNWLCPDVMAALRDSRQFEWIDTRWGAEKLHTLRIYRLKRPADPVVSALGGDQGQKTVARLPRKNEEE